MSGWKRIPCSYKDLQLIGTLNGGQSFRWDYNEKSDEWFGVFSKTVWNLKVEESNLFYKVIGSLHTNKQDLKSLLINYFRLDVDLLKLYDDWSRKDIYFLEAGKKFYGIRMLAQEPVENLFSFICSQNNHISRISSMIEKLCTKYGEKICEYNGKQYYSFPEVQTLADKNVEPTLRELGFGYRAKFIQRSAEMIVNNGSTEWFVQLQKMDYKDAKCELVKLHGIGPKVADCICLMSLNHLESVPVDTHVYQIAADKYLKHLRGRKSVTDKMYNEIGDFFRGLYGPKAGWAHTVLFCADLKKFQNEDVTFKNQNRKRKCS